MAEDSEAGVVTKLSPRAFADTVTRLKELVAAKNLKLFSAARRRAPPSWTPRRCPRSTCHSRC
jgi:hypothetical protein